MAKPTTYDIEIEERVTRSTVVRVDVPDGTVKVKSLAIKAAMQAVAIDRSNVLWTAASEPTLVYRKTFDVEEGKSGADAAVTQPITQLLEGADGGDDDDPFAGAP